MGTSYESDDIHTIYAEFVELEKEINITGLSIKKLALDAAVTSADYENAKNQTLVLMFAEETGDASKGIKPFKRTEKQREALYRVEHADLRLLRGIAGSAHKSEQDYLEALIARLDGLRSRKGLIVIDHDRRTGQGA